jgi:drug/metabolite transporter (DMT)-like permease
LARLASGAAVLFALAEQTVNSSTAGIINATTPLWTVVLALAVRHQKRVGWWQAAGLVIGFAGAVLIFAPWRTSSELFSAGGLESLGASVSYAVSYIYMDRFLARQGIGAIVLSACQLAAAAVMLAVVLMVSGVRTPELTAENVTAIAVLGVAGTGFAYVLNYQIITSDGATVASTVTYLLPVVAIVLGVLVLSEEITAMTLEGIALVLVGVALTRRPARPPADKSPDEKTRTEKTRKAPLSLRPAIQLPLVPGARLTAEVGRVSRADRDESGLGQHLLRRDVPQRGGGPERAQPVPRRRQPAQLKHGRGRHAAAGDVLSDPVAEFRGAVPREEEVEPAEDRAVLVDEHVVGAAAGLLLGQQGTVPRGELVEEVIAAVGDEGGEVAAVGPLEGQDRLGVAGVQPLQLGHGADSTQPPHQEVAPGPAGGHPGAARPSRKVSVIVENFEPITYCGAPAEISAFPGTGLSASM